MIRRRQHREDGQVLPIVALFIVVFAALMFLVIDIGRVYIAQQQLQNAVNAAAAAAGQQMPNDSAAYTQAVDYSGLPGERNALFGYDVTNPSTGLTVTFECLSHGPGYTAGTNGANPNCPSDTSTQDTSSLCHPTGAASPLPARQTTCNAVVVSEKATVKSIFGGLLFPSWNVSATAIAAAPGVKSVPVHAFVILDNTNSMADPCINSADPSVSLVPGIPVTDSTGRNPQQLSPTKLDCAKYGVQALLQTLEPCTLQGSLPPTTSCGATTANTDSQGANVANPEGEVGLLVIPALTTSASNNPLNPAAPTAPNGIPLPDELDCSATQSFNDIYPDYTTPTPTNPVPTADEYSGYEAVGLSSDYRTSDASTTLNSSSAVVQAVNWVGSGCPATWPTSAANDSNDYYGLKDIGGHHSFLAGAITEAEYLLEQNAQPGVKNAIIIESDGDLNDPDNESGFKISPTNDSNPCEDAVNAATQAKSVTSTDTLIFSIEYDSSSENCDTGDSLTPDQTMQDMATTSAAPYYYDDPDPGDLTLPFTEVADSLGETRLLANCTNAPPAC
jgi:hypothetical protein